MKDKPSCDALDIGHPQLHNLYRYWLGQSQAGNIPSRTHFDAVDLAAWLGHLMIIQPVHDGEDFLYKLHGTSLVGIVGDDLTGMLLSSLGGAERREHIARQYQRVCKSGCPEYKDSDNPFERNYKSIRKLILPIANDGKNVDCLIVGVYGEVNWSTRGVDNQISNLSSFLR